MSVMAFFKCKKTIARLHEGPLNTYIGIYADRLVSEGHCYQSGARGIRVAAGYSAWLVRKYHGVTDVNKDPIKQCKRFRKNIVARFLVITPHLLDFLRLSERPMRSHLHHNGVGASVTGCKRL
jgi:hypothetical protein